MIKPSDQPPLIVHINYSLDTGGLENGLVNLINNTPPHLFRHVIICLYQSGRFSELLQHPVSIYALNKQPGTDPGMYWRLFRLLHKLQPKIIHTRNIAALATVPCSLFLPGVKRVHAEHGRDMVELSGNYFRYNSLRKILRPFINRYIAISKDLEKWLVQSIHVKPSKIRQFYDGVDSQCFHPQAGSATPKGLPWSKEEKPLILGTVGRLAQVKNQQFLLKAYALLKDRQPEYYLQSRLLIVGDGPLAEECQGLSDKLGVAKHVVFTGDRSDVPDLLRQMDIFILPSLSEGISLTILEAMATELPVIATNSGGTPELITDYKNGRLVPVDQPDILANILIELIEDKTMRHKLALAGRHMIEKNFTWQQTVLDYLKVYKELIHPKKTQS